MSPSSELRSASPLKGEAVTCINLTNFTASPLRGEAGWKPDEGGIDVNLHKCYDFLILFFNTYSIVKKTEKLLQLVQT